MKLARIRSIGAEPAELEEDHGRAGQAGRPAEQAAQCPGGRRRGVTRAPVVAPSEAEDRDRREHERADRPAQRALVDDAQQVGADRHHHRRRDAQEQLVPAAVHEPRRRRDERPRQDELEQQRDGHGDRGAVQRRQGGERISADPNPEKPRTTPASSAAAAAAANARRADVDARAGGVDHRRRRWPGDPLHPGHARDGVRRRARGARRAPRPRAAAAARPACGEAVGAPRGPGGPTNGGVPVLGAVGVAVEPAPLGSRRPARLASSRVGGAVHLRLLGGSRIGARIRILACDARAHIGRTERPRARRPLTSRPATPQ